MDSDKPNKKQKKAVQKYNLHEAEDLFGSLLSDDGADNDDDMFGLDEGLYDDSYADLLEGDEQALDSGEERTEEEPLLYEDTYSDLLAGDEQALATEEEQVAPETGSPDEISPVEETEEEEIAEEAEAEPAAAAVTPAILEYIGGMRQEVGAAKLFEPQENTILLTDEETNDEAIVFFEQILCLRFSDLPAGLSGKGKRSATPEIIKTIDGKSYHELVAAEQVLKDLLFCFSTEEQSPYPYALFPKANIKKRTQEKELTDILLEKRFISKVILKRALQEYELIKNMTLEKIIAQKARTPVGKIEEALEEAQQGPLQGMQKEEILLVSGLANEEEIFAALEELEKINKLEIGQFLIEKGIVQETEVFSALADKHRVPFIDLTGRKFSKETLACLPQNLVQKHEILPIAMKNDTLIVASHSVDMTHLDAAIIKAAGCNHVLYVLSPPSQLKKIIHLFYNKRKQ